MLERGIEWLKQYQEEQAATSRQCRRRRQRHRQKASHTKQYADNIDALVYMVLVDADVKNDTMRDRLYKDRTQARRLRLSQFSASRSTNSTKPKSSRWSCSNISQFVVEDNENQTAYLNLPQDIWWYWYGSEFEANAYYLKLLAASIRKARSRRGS